MPRCLLIALSSCAALAAGAPAAVADVEDEIVFQRVPGLGAAQARDVRGDAGVRGVDRLRIERTAVVEAAGGDRAEALAALRSDPRVAWAEPNRVVRAAVVQDPMFGTQWGLRNTGQSILGQWGVSGADIAAEDAWVSSRGVGVTVGVVDSGADLDHPDLRLVGGRDYIDDDTTPTDGNGHGTHVSGIIAAAANTVGVTGVAPEAQVMPLRMLDDDGEGTTANSAAAFDYAGDLGLRVVNASIGGDEPTLVEQTAIQSHPNTLYVVAAGNDGDNVDALGTWPCKYAEANVLCVGASDNRDDPAGFSNFGATSVDLFAPGHFIRATYPNDSYEWMSGTSMASPMVAGAAALLFAYDSTLTVAEVKAGLMDGADRPAALACKSVSGGRLDAAAAIAVVAQTGNPAAPTAVAAVAGPGDGAVTLSWSPSAGAVRYDVFQAGADGCWPGSATTATESTSVTLSGLERGRWYAFRVRAVDADDDLSTFSPATTVWVKAAAVTPPVVDPPAVVPTPPGTTAPTPTDAGPRVLSLRVNGRVVACRRGCRSRVASLQVSMSAAARVTVSLSRRKCRYGTCRWLRASRRRISLSAGTNRLPIRSSLAGMKLTPGGWKVTVASSAGSRSTTFKVSGARR